MTQLSRPPKKYTSGATGARCRCSPSVRDPGGDELPGGLEGVGRGEVRNSVGHPKGAGTACPPVRQVGRERKVQTKSWEGRFMWVSLVVGICWKCKTSHKL